MRYLLVLPFLAVLNLDAATVFSQGALAFTKEIGTAPVEDVDCILPDVCLTRGTAGGIYNALTGSSSGMIWAKGHIENWDQLDYAFPYMDGRTVFDQEIGQPFVLHLIEHDIYLEVTFAWWSVGRPGSGAPGMPVHGSQTPGFAYTRTFAVAGSAPIITLQPVGQRVVVGHPAQLRVAALGDPSPAFQWLKDGNPIPGATNPIVSVPSLAYPDSGTYSVAVSNSSGTVISDPAVVSVWNGLIAAYPYSENFDPNPVVQKWLPAPYWSGFSSDPANSVLEVGTVASPGYCGAAAARMGERTPGSHNLNEAILTLDLAGRSGVRLAFRHGVLDSFPVTDETMPANFTGHADGNGVAISIDGASWHKIQGLNPSEGALRQAYKSFNLNLDSATAAAGLSYSNAFRIKFQQSGLLASVRNGHCFDDLKVVAAAP